MKRYDIINSLINRNSLLSYLEIGVFNGDNFNRIKCDLKESVDPTYPATHQMESDLFFKLNKKKYDLIFIDGLHTADQAYKDIMNSLRLKPKFIVVHDCNPTTEWHTRSHGEYKQGEEWNGTTYQGFIRVKHEHPELICFTVDADYGCGIISGELLGYVTWDKFDLMRISLLDLISVDEFKDMI